jgi:peptide/nickel transport system substrate-binding protein
MKKPVSLRRAAALLFGAGLALSAAQARAGGTLVVGMTAGDLPITTGNPDQGFEGYRFVGYNLYDSLILWDLSKADRASDLRPGLAAEWAIDPNNTKALGHEAAPWCEVARRLPVHRR